MPSPGFQKFCVTPPTDHPRKAAAGCDDSSVQGWGGEAGGAPAGWTAVGGEGAAPARFEGGGVAAEAEAAEAVAGEGEGEEAVVPAEDYEEAKGFAGAKEGWVFKLGPNGLGYYRDR